jgi:hypothetical protein
MSGHANQSKVEYITEISHYLVTKQEFSVDDLDNVVVPIRLPVTCDLFFTTLLKSHGMRMSLTVNEERVCAVTYDADHGQKSAHVDITAHLKAGINRLRCRCLVSRLPLTSVYDEGLLVVSGEGSSVIKKKFSASGDIEPFDISWSLLVKS